MSDTGTIIYQVSDTSLILALFLSLVQVKLSEMQAALTMFWLSSQLLHSLHAVKLYALGVARRADRLVLHIYDVLEVRDLRKHILRNKETRDAQLGRFLSQPVSSSAVNSGGHLQWQVEIVFTYCCRQQHKHHVA